MSTDREIIPGNVTHLSTFERRSGTLHRPAHRDPASHPMDRAARPDGYAAGERKKFVAKGHDRQLEEAQFGGHRVRLTNLAGERVYGTITRRDKFTITLRHEAEGGEVAGLEEVFYKHAIEGVLVFPKNRDSQE